MNDEPSGNFEPLSTGGVKAEDDPRTAEVTSRWKSAVVPPPQPSVSHLVDDAPPRAHLHGLVAAVLDHLHVHLGRRGLRVRARTREREYCQGQQEPRHDMNLPYRGKSGLQKTPASLCAHGLANAKGSRTHLLKSAVSERSLISFKTTVNAIRIDVRYLSRKRDNSVSPDALLTKGREDRAMVLLSGDPQLQLHHPAVGVTVDPGNFLARGVVEDSV